MVNDPQVFLVVSAILFGIGLMGLVIRRNPLIMFMSIELMLNASNIAFVTFSKFGPTSGHSLGGAADGPVFAFIVMTIAAAEAVVGLAIIITIFRKRRSVDVGRTGGSEGITMDSIWLTLLFPILGAITLSTFGDRLSKAMVGLVATGSVVASFVVVLLRVRAMLSLEVPRVVEAPLWTWLEIPLPNGQSVPIGFTALVDTLSITLLLVITGVGGLIHWYSTEYMAEEKHYSRYFTYLNLFVAAMTLLVLANNLAVLLIGWAGVGFASWALIGFFTHKPSAVAAARKAFVVNVIGDVGLMVSIFVAAWHLGSTDYSAILLPANYAKGSDFMGSAHIFAAGLLVAAYAKSAQLPMHTWLPDAMEGPTPVSALIHAATMVTAGVYLVVRCGGVFTHLPDMAILVAGLGAFTALFAAICALFQNDLKRVLAYSTMSQLGYMFMAAGVGAYQAAIFHLVIHAFFKALLFLAAGNVIHATHGEQDMRKLGGLLKDLPLTSGDFCHWCAGAHWSSPGCGFLVKRNDSWFGAPFHRSLCRTLVRGGSGDRSTDRVLYWKSIFSDFLGARSGGPGISICQVRKRR